MEENPIEQTRLAIAAITSAMALAMDDQNPGFADRFKKRLDQAYYRVSDGPLSHIGAMEMLKWTREMLSNR